MFGPIALHDSLRDLYVRYLDSAMPLGHEALNAERLELFRLNGVICQPPLIEPIPRYAETVTLTAACKQLVEDHPTAPATKKAALFSALVHSTAIVSAELVTVVSVFNHFLSPKESFAFASSRLAQITLVSFTLTPCRLR